MLPTFLDQAGRAKIETAFDDKTADEIEKTDPAIARILPGTPPGSDEIVGDEGGCWGCLATLPVTRSG